MRFLTFADKSGMPALGVLRGGNILDLNKWLGDTNPLRWTMLTLIAASAEQPDVYRGLVDNLHTVDDDELGSRGLLKPMDKATLYAPIPFPRCNVICLGHNYSDHAAKSKLARGEQMQVDRLDYTNFFTKSTGAVNGPYSDIPFYPGVSTQITGRRACIRYRQAREKHPSRQGNGPRLRLYDRERRHCTRPAKALCRPVLQRQEPRRVMPHGPYLVTSDEIPMSTTSISKCE